MARMVQTFYAVHISSTQVRTYNMKLPKLITCRFALTCMKNLSFFKQDSQEKDSDEPKVVKRVKVIIMGLNKKFKSQVQNFSMQAFLLGNSKHLFGSVCSDTGGGGCAGVGDLCDCGGN